MGSDYISPYYLLMQDYAFPYCYTVKSRFYIYKMVYVDANKHQLWAFMVMIT